MIAALQRGEREAEVNSQAVAPAKGCVGEASASESRNTQSCYPGKQQLTEIEEAGGNTARNPSNPSLSLLPPSPYLCLSEHYCANVSGRKVLAMRSPDTPTLRFPSLLVSQLRLSPLLPPERFLEPDFVSSSWKRDLPGKPADAHSSLTPYPHGLKEDDQLSLRNPQMGG